MRQNKEQTSTPTTEQQTENGIHPNYSYTKWDYEEKNHCYNTRQNKQPISTPTTNEQSENERYKILESGTYITQGRHIELTKCLFLFLFPLTDSIYKKFHKRRIPKSCLVCHKKALHNHKCPSISSSLPLPQQRRTKKPNRTGSKSPRYIATHPTNTYQTHRDIIEPKFYNLFCYN